MRKTRLLLALALILSFASVCWAEDTVAYYVCRKEWYENQGDLADENYFAPSVGYYAESIGATGWTTIWHNVNFYLIKVLATDAQHQDIQSNLQTLHGRLVATTWSEVLDHIGEDPNVGQLINAQRIRNGRVAGQ